MTDDDIHAWATDHWHQMRQPAYLGILDSGRQVKRLCDFVRSAIADERARADRLVSSAQDARREANTKLRHRNALVKKIRIILETPDFQRLLVKQKEPQKALFRRIGVKITEEAKDGG